LDGLLAPGASISKTQGACDAGGLALLQQWCTAPSPQNSKITLSMHVIVSLSFFGPSFSVEGAAQKENWRCSTFIPHLFF